MLVTARAEYACLAMLELAARYWDPKPVRLVDMTDKHGIPKRFLVQILLQLKAAGLVVATRGACGGYQLARAPEQISLADILGVLDRMDEPEARSISPSSMARGLQKVWRGLADARNEYLERFKLIDLVPRGNQDEYVI